ncbi:MAG: Glu-tRNA(Gln) amidotransferase GatDE subunit D, partial [Candidatus ainarchaeum sp.]|nr:Glu-tRNA(Gln) amidotransferase GatDE subunit D [Candidatus ainarchaeum sp.]
VYTNLRKLSEIGVIYCEDMLPETALMKLSWLLGNYSKEESKKLLNTNICGEISEFSRIDVFE